MKPWRPDSNLAKLSEDAFELACGMAESVRPRYTAEQIITELADKYRANINRNNVTELRIYLAEKRAAETRTAMHRMVLSEEIAKRLGLDEDGSNLLRHALQAAVLANETDLKSVDPDRLAALVLRQERNALLKEKIDNDRQNLELKNKKLEMELEEKKRELEIRAAAEAAKERAAQEVLDRAEKRAAGDPERAALAAIRKALGIEKPEAA